MYLLIFEMQDKKEKEKTYSKTMKNENIHHEAVFSDTSSSLP
jgi:hypothetical protein